MIPLHQLCPAKVDRIPQQALAGEVPQSLTWATPNQTDMASELAREGALLESALAGLGVSHASDARSRVPVLHDEHACGDASLATQCGTLSMGLLLSLALWLCARLHEGQISPQAPKICAWPPVGAQRICRLA